MSHEGIRFVSAEQAAKDAAAEKRLPVEAVTPAKVRIHKTEGTGVEIDWKDGHKSAWTFAWLRHGCPCAICHEEREQNGRKPGVPKPKPQSLLPMYEAPPRPVEITPVGNYAVKFKWNDGHESGVYSWEYLRRVCQCAECTASI
ncbi:MAG TPA: DUF971 domain-containing protein [Edaphobacter sp.]|nr:DUF971 domain-containing protein [Edaphobacter sp.]